MGKQRRVWSGRSIPILKVNLVHQLNSQQMFPLTGIHTNLGVHALVVKLCQHKTDDDRLSHHRS